MKLRAFFFSKWHTFGTLFRKHQILTKPYDAIRNGLISCSITTFRKYANALGYVRPRTYRAKAKKGFKSSYVFEWLHIDITNVRTIKDGILKVAFVKDNFSSALLHYRSTAEKAGSQFIKELLEEILKNLISIIIKKTFIFFLMVGQKTKMKSYRG